ncbi:MAG: phosphate transport system protein [Saprospiraceae bacterium]|jgi:phosphate transport system protein
METDLHINQHISRRFNKELEQLRTKVLEMGGVVEQQVVDGTSALVDSDAELGARVVQRDKEVNALEVAMDESCVDIIARRQPAASDLRLIVSIIKTITDLERIGDQAEKLGAFAVQLSDEGVSADKYSNLENISEKALKVLRQALDSFARMDAEAALEAAKMDKKVDKEYDAILRQVMTHMMEDPREIANAMRVLWAARALERIGDHATNISEYVVYLVKGKDIRHLSN